MFFPFWAYSFRSVLKIRGFGLSGGLLGAAWRAVWRVAWRAAWRAAWKALSVDWALSRVSKGFVRGVEESGWHTAGRTPWFCAFLQGGGGETHCQEYRIPEGNRYLVVVENVCGGPEGWTRYLILSKTEM